MSKAKGYIAVILLIASLTALWRITAAALPWQAAAAVNKGGEIAKLDLGQVAVQSYNKMGFTKAFVHHIAGAGWVVGTENGEILLAGNDAKVLWRRGLGIGKVSSLAVSGDVILVGEQSPDGNIYALNAKDGQIIWSFATVQGVGGASGARSTSPMAVWLGADKMGRVYAVSYRFGQEKRGERSYYSKIYAFTHQGEVVWQFPQDEPMDAWCNWAALSGDGGPLVFSTANYDITPGRKYPDNIYWLDRDGGKAFKSLVLERLKELSAGTTIRNSPNFAVDGKTMAFITSDGRGFYCGADGAVIWERTLSRPARIAGTMVNSIGRGAYVLPEGIFFTTINTFNRDNWRLPTPLEHPSGNSLFCFSPDGELRYKIAMGGNIEDIAFAAGYAAAAVGRNVQNRDYAAHGCKAIDLTSGQVLRSFTTAGPCQAAAISGDGKYAAAVEAPAVLEDGRIFGSYSLHIWEL